MRNGTFLISRFPVFLFSCFPDFNAVIQVEKRHDEIRAIRVKLRFQRLAEVDRPVVICLDLLEAAAPALHVVHPAEYIRNHRIAALGGNIVRIQFLHPRAIHHTTGRVNLHPIIKDVNMHLTAGDHVIPVNQGVDQALEHSALWIVRHFSTSGIRLFPALFCVIAHKVFSILKKRDQTAAELLVIQRFHHAGRLVQPIPAGTKQPGESHGRFVSQQRARMGQEALFIYQSERNKVLCVHFKTGALAVNRAELGKGKALKPIQRGEAVIGAVASAKNKPFQVGGCGLYALIAHTDIGDASAISNIVIRRFSPCSDVKQNEVLSLLLPDLQLN